MQGSPHYYYTQPRANVYFIDNGNMDCIPLGHTIHVPSINEKNIGQGTGIWKPCGAP